MLGDLLVIANKKKVVAVRLHSVVRCLHASPRTKCSIRVKLWRLYVPCGCGRPPCEVLIAREYGSRRCDRESAGQSHSARDICEQDSSLHVGDREPRALGVSYGASFHSAL